MNDGLRSLRPILERLGSLERQRQPSYRQGVVATTEPLTVYLGGSDTAVPAGAANGARPRVGDVVAAVSWKQGVLILGVLGTGAPAWVAITPASDWVASSSRPAYWVDATRRVSFRGWLTKATAWRAGDRIAQLPAGVLPGLFDRYATPSATGTALLDVGTDGWIAINSIESSAAWSSSSTVMSLSGIRFIAER